MTSHNPKAPQRGTSMRPAAQPFESKQELWKAIKKSHTHRNYSFVQEIGQRLSNTIPACWPDADEVFPDV